MTIKHLFVFRFSNINDVFIKNYGHPPQFYARAPGRVNIIGKIMSIVLFLRISVVQYVCKFGC